MAEHYILKCSCGVVLAQCRCPGPKTEKVSKSPCVHTGLAIHDNEQYLRELADLVLPASARPRVYHLEKAMSDFIAAAGVELKAEHDLISQFRNVAAVLLLERAERMTETTRPQMRVAEATDAGSVFCEDSPTGWVSK